VNFKSSTSKRRQRENQYSVVKEQAGSKALPFFVSEDNFLYSSFLDSALQYNISNVNLQFGLEIGAYSKGNLSLDYP
jgi:hypothetical protein